MRKSLCAAIAVAAVLGPAGVAAAGTPPPEQSALARIPVTCTFTDATLTIHTQLPGLEWYSADVVKVW